MSSGRLHWIICTNCRSTNFSNFLNEEIIEFSGGNGIIRCDVTASENVINGLPKLLWSWFVRVDCIRPEFSSFGKEHSVIWSQIVPPLFCWVDRSSVVFALLDRLSSRLDCFFTSRHVECMVRYDQLLVNNGAQPVNQILWAARIKLTVQFRKFMRIWLLGQAGISSYHNGFSLYSSLLCVRLC